MLRLGVAAALVLLVSSACFNSYLVRPGETPVAFGHTPSEQRLMTWQRAVYALLEQGYVPDLLNESAGYISAKRREDLQADALTGTVAVVVVAPDGTVRVQVSGVGLFTSEDDAKKQIGERQTLLLAAILGPSAPAPNGKGM